jgi:hypothetical protein
MAAVQGMPVEGYGFNADFSEGRARGISAGLFGRPLGRLKSLPCCTKRSGTH